jgi:hypothetical protein
MSETSINPGLESLLTTQMHMVLTSLKQPVEALPAPMDAAIGREN